VFQATIGSIRARVTWTKIKSQAITITIDEMQIKLEATTSGQEEYDELDPELLAIESVPGEKYGFIDAVTDGVQINVSNIDISLHGPDFDGTVSYLRTVLLSVTQLHPSTVRTHKQTNRHTHTYTHT
jgi:hypothetical protein